MNYENSEPPAKKRKRDQDASDVPEGYVVPDYHTFSFK